MQEPKKKNYLSISNGLHDYYPSLSQRKEHGFPVKWTLSELPAFFIALSRLRRAIITGSSVSKEGGWMLLERHEPLERYQFTGRKPDAQRGTTGFPRFLQNLRNRSRTPSATVPIHPWEWFFESRARTAVPRRVPGNAISPNVSVKSNSFD